jgi:hypothetical protein
MRWRHVREGRPTAADANRHDEVLVVRPDGTKQSVQWHNLHEYVEWWAPFDELPDPSTTHPMPKKKWRPFNDVEALSLIGKVVHSRRHVRAMITGVGAGKVYCDGHRPTYQELLDGFVFVEDGSPCGVEVTE